MNEFKHLADVGRDLSPGQSATGHACPKCGRTGSFSVFATDTGYGFRCHRAACNYARFYQTVPGLNASRRLAVAPGPTSHRAFKPYPFPLEFPAADNPIWRRVAPRGAGGGAPGPELAAQLGLSARAGFGTEIVWTLRDFDMRVLGHVSRDYETKTIRTWRAAGDALYGYWAFGPAMSMWIVEDPVSAARVAMEGGSAMALLGTHLGPAASAELEAHVRRTLTHRPLRLVVALDPDAVNVSVALARRLTERLPCEILWAPLRQDPKDLDPAELARLIRTW